MCMPGSPWTHCVALTNLYSQPACLNLLPHLVPTLFLLLFLTNLISSRSQCTPPSCFVNFLWLLSDTGQFDKVRIFCVKPFIKFYLFLMRMRVFATCVYGHHPCAWCPQKWEGRVRSPGVGVPDSCEVSCSLCSSLCRPHRFLFEVTWNFLSQWCLHIWRCGGRVVGFWSVEEF